MDLLAPLLKADDLQWLSEEWSSAVMLKQCVKTLGYRGIFGRVAIILDYLVLVFGHYLVVGRGFLKEGRRNDLAETRCCHLLQDQTCS